MGARFDKPAVAMMLLALIGVGVGVWFFFVRGAQSNFDQPDFDQFGGTILVYEMADQGDAAAMVKALQIRLDPDGRGDASVNVVAKGRVGIRIPRTGAGHAEDIARIKELVLMVGRLEFLMLANSIDDKLAIEEAQFLLRAENTQDEIKQLQARGLPPPAPRDAATKQPSVFSINLAKGAKSQVTYRWVELGPQGRASLNLDRRSPHGSTCWQDADKHLGKAALWKGKYCDDCPESYEKSGALFYGRACGNQLMPEEERRKKRVDYFVLVREPELDSSKPSNLPPAERLTRRLDESFITSAKADSLDGAWWSVSTSLSAEGAQLMRTLTKKNVPTARQGESDLWRYLGIILDGQVIVAAPIHSEIGQGATISGNLTEADARKLVAVLRAGALPGRLKPLPVSETYVPAKGRG